MYRSYTPVSKSVPVLGLFLIRFFWRPSYHLRICGPSLAVLDTDQFGKHCCRSPTNNTLNTDCVLSEKVHMGVPAFGLCILQAQRPIVLRPLDVNGMFMLAGEGGMGKRGEGQQVGCQRVSPDLS